MNPIRVADYRAINPSFSDASKEFVTKSKELLCNYLSLQNLTRECVKPEAIRLKSIRNVNLSLDNLGIKQEVYPAVVGYKPPTYRGWNIVLEVNNDEYSANAASVDGRMQIYFDRFDFQVVISKDIVCSIAQKIGEIIKTKISLKDVVIVKTSTLNVDRETLSAYPAPDRSVKNYLNSLTPAYAITLNILNRQYELNLLKDGSKALNTRLFESNEEGERPLKTNNSHLRSWRILKPINDEKPFDLLKKCPSELVDKAKAFINLPDLKLISERAALLKFGQSRDRFSSSPGWLLVFELGNEKHEVYLDDEGKNFMINVPGMQ